MRRELTLPLHYGKPPRWLFQKMVRLSRAIIETILLDHPPVFIMKRFSDPFWFQSFGCILGFDWHSSGLTTTVLGAVKIALKDLNAGLFLCGGKGKTARKTPEEINLIGDETGIDAENLIKISRLVAKVDSSMIQDGFNIYHHTIMFDLHGSWAVIQQGMNIKERKARRYHWDGSEINSFIEEPHSGIISEGFFSPLNLVHRDSRGNRNLILELSRRLPEENIREIEMIKKSLPDRHNIEVEDIHPERLYKIYLKTYENPPEDFESLLLKNGMGPKSIRALSLIGELIYGEKPSYEDPARFSFVHGGKDGIPYPVDRELYEKTINFFEETVKRAKVGDRERIKLLKKIKEL